MKIIVTGATGAIGEALSKKLLQQGHTVIMACRNISKAELLRQNFISSLAVSPVDIIIRELDLSESKSILKFVDQLIDEKHVVDGLINNAGTIMRHFVTNRDGYEMTFAVNYMGLIQLTQLLIPVFSEKASIVNVNSLAKHPRYLNQSIFEVEEKRFSQLKAYLLSKTALTVYTARLSRELTENIRANVADPGIVNSEFIRLERWFDILADVLFRPFTKSPENSTTPILNALFSKNSGLQFKGNKSRPINSKYAYHSLLDWLWSETNLRITMIRQKE